DAVRNATLVADALVRATTQFRYAAPFNQVSSIIDPNGQTTTITYDAQGNPTQRQTPLGRTVAYTYDARGLLTSSTSPLGTTTTYTYDSLGNPAQMAQGTGPDQRIPGLTSGTGRPLARLPE